MKKVEQLNQIISEFTVLYQKTRHFHWHVQGSEFFTLHVKFEEIYDAINETIDKLAERVVGLNGQSITSLRQALQLASLVEETDKYPSGEKMVQELISDLEKISKLLTEVAGSIDDSKDRHTVNLLDEALDMVESHIWMLKALKF